ncbi:MAG: AIDA repeat-containing protein, partial [Lentisphaeria bacterium]|nr:AIDA repeat-containing protein [Lentisphaeria bacterium]
MSGTMTVDGLQYCPQNADGTQFVFLDFDGAYTVYSNADLGVEYDLTVQDSGISAERQEWILAELNEKYSGSNIVFTNTVAADMGEYSTVYIGMAEGFDDDREFFGLSETIDCGNLIKNDDAYVFFDDRAEDDQILSVINHELGHILAGETHSVDATGTIRDYAVQSYLLSTKWTQSSPYNKYCPIDPVNGGRSYTGCTNTAAGQIIYYWIENGLLDLELTLTSADAYTSQMNGSTITINASSGTASQYGYLSFSQTNALLQNFAVGNMDSIAALCFAAGVVQKSDYSASGTATIWDTDLFVRAGMSPNVRFDEAGYSNPYLGSTTFFPSGATKGYYCGLTEAGWNLLTSDLKAGRPVAVSILSAYGDGTIGRHAIVADGYDSSTGKIHLNFGWGGPSDGWYTRNELDNKFGIYRMVTGLEPDGTVMLPASVKLYSSGVLTSSGTKISGARLISGGNNSMTVSSGGIANSTTVNYQGYMYIFSGGTANSTTVNSSGYMYLSGGTANSTYVSNGKMYLSGGTANRTTLNGSMYLVGGTANGTVAGQSAYMFISGSGVANSTTVNSGGSIGIYSGGVANSTTVNSRGKVALYSGAALNNASVSSGGGVHISSGGTANRTTVNSYGNVYISNGGTAAGTTLNSNGWMSVSNGGVANSTTINPNGKLFVNNGGKANNTTLNSNGYLYISSGGTANNTVINSARGFMYVLSGGTANGITIKSEGGTLFVSSGGTATNIVASACAAMVITVAPNTYIQGTYTGSAFEMKNALLSGFTANYTDVNIVSGGTAKDTTVYGGVMRVDNGGTASGTNLEFYSLLYIYSGGVHRGSLQIGSGTSVSASSGAVIDFTVSGRTAADGYLINNLSSISGTPTYTITVSANQAAGTYKLAQGANNFSGSYVIGDGLAIYGAITVNGDILENNGIRYKLEQSGGNLTLTINNDTQPPATVFLYSSGTLTSSSAEITGAVLAAGGNNSMYISSGGVANRTTVNSGYMSISSGGVASNTTVASNGHMYIYDGGAANSTIVTPAGYMFISSGGTATNIVASSGAGFGITVASDTYIQGTSAGSAFEMKNAYISGYAINSAGIMYITNCGVANH